MTLQLLNDKILALKNELLESGYSRQECQRRILAVLLKGMPTVEIKTALSGHIRRGLAQGMTVKSVLTGFVFLLDCELATQREVEEVQEVKKEGKKPRKKEPIAQQVYQQTPPRKKNQNTDDMARMQFLRMFLERQVLMEMCGMTVKPQLAFNPTLCLS